MRLLQVDEQKQIDFNVLRLDAETYAPEGFEEFFNQRRCWTPSSVANTLDLLADYKDRVYEKNWNLRKIKNFIDLFKIITRSNFKIIV